MTVEERWTGDRPVAGVPFTLRRRMHWGDGDAARMGYTPRFVDYAMEAAECWWEDRLGTDWLGLNRQRGLACPVASMSFDFAHPVRPGERIDLAVRLEKVGNSSLVLRIAGRLPDGPECFSARLVSVIASLETMKSHRIPDDLRARMERDMRTCERADRGIRPAAEVLDFWLGPERGWRDAWFHKDAAFDAEIRRRFLATWEAAAAGELEEWLADPASALALAVVLDQFPRNMFRGEARAFASDARARRAAEAALAAGYDKGLPLHHAFFFYLPFEHSEDEADLKRCVALVRRHAGEPQYAACLRAAERHLEIVRRFGRYPHRNRALGRPDTAEEAAFLREPNSAF